MWDYTYTFDTALPCNTISRGIHVMTKRNNNNTLLVTDIEPIVIFRNERYILCHGDMVHYGGVVYNSKGYPIYGPRANSGHGPYWLGLCDNCKYRIGAEPDVESI